MVYIDTPLSNYSLSKCRRGYVYNIPMSIIVAVQDKIMECPKFQKSPNVRTNAFSYVNLPFYQFLPLENHLKMVEECLLDKLCLQSYKKQSEIQSFSIKKTSVCLVFKVYCGKYNAKLLYRTRKRNPHIGFLNSLQDKDYYLLYVLSSAAITLDVPLRFALI